MEAEKAARGALMGQDTSNWGAGMSQAALGGINTAGAYQGGVDTQWGQAMSQKALSGVNNASQNALYQGGPTQWGAQATMVSAEQKAFMKTNAALVFAAADADKNGKLTLKEISDYIKTDEVAQEALGGNGDFAEHVSKDAAWASGEMTKVQFCEYYVAKCIA